MKIGGIIIGLLGAILFAVHFILAEFYPEQHGYFSHQVRAADAVIVVVFGGVIYCVGVWRGSRREKKIASRKS